jgi:hypothetical protein
MSNLVPLLFVAPLPAVAVSLSQAGKSDQAFYVWVSIPVVLWLAINFFSLFQNKSMRREMLGKLLADRPGIEERSFFVGFARPKRKAAIHTHEDIGWLILHPDRLEFFGDTLNHELPRSTIRSIRFGANMNSLLLLGRWVLVEAEVEGKRVRLQVEPREKSTMLGNLVFSKRLAEELRAWARPGR